MKTTQLRTRFSQEMYSFEQSLTKTLRNEPKRDVEDILYRSVTNIAKSTIRNDMHLRLHL